MNWLFLRGAWDERTRKSIDDNDDMWLQLFAALVGENDYGNIYFKDKFDGSDCPEAIKYTHNCDIATYFTGGIVGDKQTIFSRGGFDWQALICRNDKNAYKIRYGAGKRFMPEPDIKYDLVLVDSYNQKKAIKEIYPDCNAQIWIKPAAEHFKYMPEVEKDFDVCYIANGQQAEIKSVKWVYDTVPRDLKVLHLGYPSKYKPPENVTCMRVDRIDMPKWINRCKVGIVPYWSGVDSCPRVIPEMMACGLPVLMADTVVYRNLLFNGGGSNKDSFWGDVKINIEYNVFYRSISEEYEKENSIEVVVNLIKQYISGFNEYNSCKI